MNIFKGAVILATSDLIETNGSAEVRRYYTSRGLDALRAGNQDVVGLQARVGSIQQRLDAISEGIDVSNTYFKTKVIDMEGADPAEATSKLSAWQTQLNAAYYAIAQIKTLSLINYLR
jgi:flagellar hook-associated protein 3 FlgL